MPDNIVVEITFLGKIFGYGQIDLYAFGGMLSLPYIKEDAHNLKIIKDIMKLLPYNKK